jgi:LPXTG-motif cell wall-anchored protein
MKTLPAERRALPIRKSRWAAYATASAATMLAGNQLVEAAIHYSGPLHVKLSGSKNVHATFQLDRPGDSLFFEHLNTLFHDSNYDFAGFKVIGRNGASFRGSPSIDFADVSHLKKGALVSQGQFTTGLASKENFGTLAATYANGYFLDPGVAYIGFFFQGNSGRQYGWARVRMHGNTNGNGFEVIDYAYADSGEPIKAGQGIPAGEDETTSLGSLGLLAAGAAGIVGWRRRRIDANAKAE